MSTTTREARWTGRGTREPTLAELLARVEYERARERGELLAFWPWEVRA